jgi:hypothetical protein
MAQRKPFLEVLSHQSLSYLYFKLSLFNILFLVIVIRYQF